jgi:hypothetical protein
LRWADGQSRQLPIIIRRWGVSAEKRLTHPPTDSTAPTARETETTEEKREEKKKITASRLERELARERAGADAGMKTRRPSAGSHPRYQHRRRRRRGQHEERGRDASHCRSSRTVSKEKTPEKRNFFHARSPGETLSRVPLCWVLHFHLRRRTLAAYRC